MSGETRGGVRIVLRVEGVCVFAVVLFLYARLGAGWGTFALFILAPDLSFFGYLAGPRVGALCYNVAHSYIGALACYVLGATLASPAFVVAALIWCAHIGFDRALGYGLKYVDGFGYTHLGRIGRARATANV
jgi:hypothetical protein